jgi:hypothetical protein
MLNLKVSKPPYEPVAGQLSEYQRADEGVTSAIIRP